MFIPVWVIAVSVTLNFIAAVVAIVIGAAIWAISKCPF